MRTICDVRAVIGSQLASEAREPTSTHHLEEHGGTVVSPQAQRCRDQCAADNRHQQKWTRQGSVGYDRRHTRLQLEFLHIGSPDAQGNAASRPLSVINYLTACKISPIIRPLAATLTPYVKAAMSDRLPRIWILTPEWRA